MTATKSAPLISPEALEALSRPPLEASTLPPECYWSPALYEAEAEAIFRKEWLCLGRVEDVPAPGDFFTASIVGEPIVVVRDGDGEIRAHLNVCRHRGCQLVEGSGSVKSFRCPYHGWMYGLDGTLRGTPDFSETRNFDKADYPLHAVRTEVWEGFVMVNLDPAATPYAERVSETTRWHRDKYGLADFVTTHRWDYDLACNWKIYVENAMEEYHVPWVHAETFQPITPMKGWIEFPDISDQPWILMVGQFPGFTLSDSGDALLPVTPTMADVPPDFDGMPIWLSYPSFAVLPVLDCMLYYLMHPTGPERMALTICLCVPPAAAEAYKNGVEGPLKAGVEEYARNIPPFVDEDNKIAQMQQVGIRSRRATPGRFSKHEGIMWRFDRWVAAQAYGGAPLDGRATNGAGRNGAA